MNGIGLLLGYEKYSIDGYNTGDSRNGYYKRTFQTKYGELNLFMPRNRAGNFKQQTLPSHAHSDDSLEQMVILICGLILEYNRESEERIHKGFLLAQAQLAELLN